MAMMTGLVTLEVGELGGPESERSVRGPMNAMYSLAEQGQGGQVQTSRELHSSRKHEHAEPAVQGVPL